MKLSQRRAESVRNYIIKNFGIAPERIRAKGYGPTKPVADNKTKEGKAQINRRSKLTSSANKRLQGVCLCAGFQGFSHQVQCIGPGYRCCHWRRHRQGRFGGCRRLAHAGHWPCSPFGDWREAKFVLRTVTDAKGKVTESAIAYGHLLGTLIDFIFIAFVVFLVTKALIKPPPPDLLPGPARNALSRSRSRHANARLVGRAWT